jgi:hypothetical protein
LAAAGIAGTCGGSKKALFMMAGVTMAFDHGRQLMKRAFERD